MSLAPVVTVAGEVRGVTDDDFTDDKGTVTRRRQADVLTSGGFARVKFPPAIELPAIGSAVSLQCQVSSWVQQGQRGITFRAIVLPAK